MNKQRPVGLIIIAILFFLGGALSFITGLLVMSSAVSLPGEYGYLFALPAVAGIVPVIIGLLDIAIGWGLLEGWKWARILAIVVLALGLIFNIISGIAALAGFEVAGERVSLVGPGLISLIIAAIEGFIIWYLFQPEIVQFFKPVQAGSVQPTQRATTPPMREPTRPITQPRPQVTPPRPPTEVIGVPPEPVGWLVVRYGPHSGKQFALRRGTTTVGRDPNRSDIVLNDPTVSSEHARIKYERGQFYIYDLASTNGTFVNNRRIQRQMLMDNDVIRFGRFEVVFKKV